MTDRDAMIRAVLAAPADDLPRLVFADWLDEHGEPARAEFIRVQCELAKLESAVRRYPPYYPYGPVVATSPPAMPILRRRERELLDANAHAWLFDLPPGFRPILPDAIRDTFHRGFVWQVSGTAADWLANADAILLANPVGRVRLTTWPGYESDPNGLSQLAGRESLHWVPRGERFDHSRRGIVEFLLGADWPGIVFELPESQQ